MPRDSGRLDKELVDALLARSPRAQLAEARAALAELSAAELDRLRKVLRLPSAAVLGPFGWADVARGVSPQVAAAREVSGYYALRAERDALAAMVGSAPRPAPKSVPAEPRREREPAPLRARKQRTPGARERAAHLLGLFAYHRDAPLVARALGVSLSDLDAELRELKIHRKAYRLARGSAFETPPAAPLPGAGAGPLLRRRSRAQAASDPAAPARTDETALLRSALAEIGPRRAALAARLGVFGPALFARFRAAGLERELALRERDLIRALWSRHRAWESKVASELGTSVEELREIVRQRGLWRELQSERDRFRREALSARWPRQRIEQVLRRRDELRELGVLDELDREVAARAGLIWKSLSGKKDARLLFTKKLHLSPADAERLQRLLDLR